MAGRRVLPRLQRHACCRADVLRRRRAEAAAAAGQSALGAQTLWLAGGLAPADATVAHSEGAGRQVPLASRRALARPGERPRRCGHQHHAGRSVRGDGPRGPLAAPGREGGHAARGLFPRADAGSEHGLIKRKFLSSFLVIGITLLELFI